MVKFNDITDIFFDLDHTLWDFQKNSALTFDFLLKKYQINIDLNKFLNIYIPINFSYWKLYRDEKITKEFLRYNRLKSSFDKLNISLSDDVINKIADDYVISLPVNNFLIKDTILVLDYLKRKYRLHIITNGFTEVQNKKIVNSNIKKYFHSIIDSETVGVKKPNIKIFDYALKVSGARSKNSLMIGDNLEADILGALNAGFHAIHFNNNNEAPHLHCLILNELKSLMECL
ncbi:MAG: YjjG family noncanonical pyrimidine nucleotidase [Flavobacteriaceae bacterium]|nr:YjjG family noncanonical pyrimidine nucleotidase [Flavobacteriaceae bacterium]